MGSGIEISPGELNELVDKNQVEFILDLRNEDEFNAWKIEGPLPIETVNIPQIDFVGEEEKYLHLLPKDKLIIITCAHGDAAKYSAEVLGSLGFSARGLAGGMDAWSMLYVTGHLEEAPIIFQTYRVAKGCISNIVISDGEAIIIDAVRHLEEIINIVARHGAKIRYVFDTHLQADHISGGPELARSVGCEYCLHPADGAGAAYKFKELTDGLKFEFGKCRLTAIHTPGHTPGSTSLLLNDRFLFAGDAVMATTVGRPDLGGMVVEWAGLLYHTIHHRLKKLNDEILILPSHAAAIKERDNNGMVSFPLGQARKNLQLFAITDQGKFLDYVKSTLLENPARYQDIRQVNLGLLQMAEEGLKELEIGKNLCGMQVNQC